MIDRRLLLSDFEATAARLSRKKVDRAVLAEVRDLVDERRGLETGRSDRRAEYNQLSREIGELFKSGRKDEAGEKRARVAVLKDEIAAMEERIGAIEAAIDQQLLYIPNLPADDAPDGHGDQDNVVLRHHGWDPAAWEGRQVPAHWDIAERLGIMDNERAAKISGSMFALLLGDGARLLRALVQFGLDLNRDRYLEVLPPSVVRTDTFTATGQLPKFKDDAYSTQDELWLIPTGEVPLMGLHRDEILDGASLPLRYMAHTSCFRREAGAAGAATRGMQRLHEFHKVELVTLCRAEQSWDCFQAKLQDAERALQLLGLPYRVLDLCAGDLTFSSARVHDLEVWAPGTGRWLEVSSVGIFTDFQARRGAIRYRDEDGRVHFVHALNGSGLATPRVWAAVLEHNVQPDGSVVIPPPLRPYMGGQERIVPRA
jgi:seryl-tRNA synthetase